MLVRIKEAAELFGVSPRALYRAIKVGSLLAVPAGGVMQIPFSDLLEYFNTRLGREKVQAHLKDYIYNFVSSMEKKIVMGTFPVQDTAATVDKTLRLMYFAQEGLDNPGTLLYLLAR